MEFKMSEKRNVRFNIIDFLILLAVLAALFSILFRSTLLKLIGNVVYTQDADIIVRMTGLTPEQADAVNEGDILFCFGERLGEINSVEKLPSTVMALSGGDNRTFVRVSDERSYDLVVSVTVRGVYNDDGFYLFGEKYLGVGKTLDISSGIYAYSSVVVSIS